MTGIIDNKISVSSVDPRGHRCQSFPLGSFYLLVKFILITPEARSVSPYKHQSINNESVSLSQWNNAFSSLRECVPSTAIETYTR